MGTSSRQKFSGVGNPLGRDASTICLTAASLMVFLPKTRSATVDEWAGVFSGARDGIGALRLALAEGDVLAGNFIKSDHEIVRRDAGGRRNAGVDVLEQGQPLLLRPSLDETDIEDDEVVSVVHADERRRVQKAVLRQLEDELEEVVGWHTERVHQSRLDGAGYSGDPRLVVAALDDVDFGERHVIASFSSRRFQCSASMASAMPCPPPMQSVTTPRVSPSRRIEWISFVVSTAPVAPIGWPWATAPPSTLTTSSGSPSSRATTMATAAKASLISTRSTERVSQPARCKACLTAGTGPKPNMPGSTAAMPDRKSTRLNSSHVAISYAVFCLKKKK